jgi:DNA-binding transcriptional MocR family regulator
MLPSQNTKTGSSSTRTSAVYTVLRQDILRGRLSPAAKLLIDEISQRYGVTSTPIREALNQLVTEGFVQKVDQKGLLGRIDRPPGSAGEPDAAVGRAIDIGGPSAVADRSICGPRSVSGERAVGRHA